MSNTSQTDIFTVKNNGIYNKTGRLICSVWPERKVSEEKEDGESWLDMRRRTEPERNAIEKRTNDRAISICDLLNAQKRKEQ